MCGWVVVNGFKLKFNDLIIHHIKNGERKEMRGKKTLNSDFTMGRYNFIRTVEARLCQFTKYVNFGILYFADAIRTLVYTIYA